MRIKSSKECAQVTRGKHIGVLKEERTDIVENIVYSSVRVERQLCRVECGDGSICSSAPVVY